MLFCTKNAFSYAEETNLLFVISVNDSIEKYPDVVTMSKNIIATTTLNFAIIFLLKLPENLFSTFPSFLNIKFSPICLIHTKKPHYEL